MSLLGFSTIRSVCILNIFTISLVSAFLAHYTFILFLLFKLLPTLSTCKSCGAWKQSFSVKFEENYQQNLQWQSSSSSVLGCFVPGGLVKFCSGGASGKAMEKSISHSVYLSILDNNLISSGVLQFPCNVIWTVFFFTKSELKPHLSRIAVSRTQNLTFFFIIFIGNI